MDKLVLMVIEQLLFLSSQNGLIKIVYPSALMLNQ